MTANADAQRSQIHVPTGAEEGAAWPPLAWAKQWWAMPAATLAYVAAWTMYACIAQSAGAVHHDMTEAWSWGQEFRLGYYKHPPLYAWVSGVWFQVFPRTDWAYYLLSEINAGMGFAGVWWLAGRFLTGNARWAAVLLWSLIPFHNIMAINFNANSMLLSLWPWTAYAFVRAVETGTVKHGVLFGVLAAASMMSKYFSALLLAGCFFASLLHPRVREIYRSPAPYVALATCVVLLLPHIGWIASNDWQTIEYAAHKANFSRDVTNYKTPTTALASFALLGLSALALVAAFGLRATIAMHVKAGKRMFWRETAWIAALAVSPFILTLMAGPLGSVKISTNFMIPVFYMLPAALLVLSTVVVTDDHLRILVRAALFYPAAAILVSPVISYVLFDRQIDLAAEPRKELAELVTLEWNKAYGQPLRIVAGTNAYGTGTVFYSKDNPHEFTRLNHAQSPWITPERLRREGLAIICLAQDGDCTSKSAALLTPDSRQMSVSLRRTFFGMKAPARAFEVFMIPPGPIPAVKEPMLHRT